jgi:hypothetical protein
MEPYSLSRNILLKNVHLNRLAGITTIFPVGASNKYAKGYITVNTENTGGASIFTD